MYLSFCRHSRLSISVLVLFLTGCLSIPQLELEHHSNQLVLKGVIDFDTPEQIENALNENPAIDTLILQWVPGSVDDQSSLTKLGQLIRSHNLTTIVPSDGVVASGGTDLLLTGAERIIEPGACIGVHTWSKSGLFSSLPGNEVPKDDPQHQLYLNFYDEMGIPESFYWFTLNAAGADAVHWMSVEEINRYSMTNSLTEPVNQVNSEGSSREEECNNRLEEYF